MLLVVFLSFLLTSYTSNGQPQCLQSLPNCFCGTTGGKFGIICQGYGISTVKAAITASNLLNTVATLTIASNSESTLPANFVHDLPQLIELHIRFGQITTITPGAFTNATNLEVLDLRDNLLTWLSGDMLSGVTTSMKQLQLDGNEIRQLSSDLEPVFLLVTNQISLTGNNLECSCQIQWLHNLLTSNVQQPNFNGAVCDDSNGNSISLSVSGLNFTECLDLCSLGYYNCPLNNTCIPTNNNSTYECLFPQSSVPVPSSSIFDSSTIFMSPTPSLGSIFSLSSSEYDFISMTDDDSISDTASIPEYSSISVMVTSEHGSFPTMVTSEHDSFSVMATSEHSSMIASEYSSMIASEYSFISSSSVYMSSSLYSMSSVAVTPTPSLCSTQSYCSLNQNCVQFDCGCSKCLCAEPLLQSANDTCVNTTGAILHCSIEESFGLHWPASANGTTVTLPCCSNTNCESVVRTCVNGQWTSPVGPNCISQGTHNLQTLLIQAMSGDPVHLQSLAQNTLNHIETGTLLPGDIASLTNLISQTVNLVNNMTNIQTVQSIVYSVSELLSDSHIDTWQQVDAATQSVVTLFNAVERLGYAVPLNNGSITITTQNLALVVLAPSEEENGWNISSNLLQNYTGGQSSIQLPASIFDSILGDRNLSGCDVRIVVSLWDINNELLEVNDTGSNQVAELVYGQCDWGASGSSTSEVIMVNSIIITASVYSSNCSLNNTRFTDPVRITLYHVNTTLDDPSCSFLDPADDSGSQWSGEGCGVDTVRSMSNYTVCNCYHLTTFALLMSPTGAASVNQPLAIATKVGLSISITALIVTVILLFSLKIESKLNQVHRQLALSLCLSQLTFLIGVDRSAVPSPDFLCTFIAAFLHYLLLCTFAWQLIEGIHLYLFVVKVFYNSKIVWAYYPLGWGIPILIVAITFGINFCDYGSLNYCWITNSHGALWAFHVPVIIVIVINLVVLVAVSFVVARASRKKDPNRCTFCSLLQASFILVPTLGLTWVLGFFVVGTDLYSTIVEWIFFLCTTLQGISIFFIHCIVNTEVRVAFLKAIGCRQAANKQKSFFELKPSAALSSIANSAGQFTRRMSLGSRRGSLDPPIGTFPSVTNKEVNAYALANALYKLEEESMEDSQMFSQSSMCNVTPKKNRSTKVKFIDEVEDSNGEISDTESSKGDKLIQELLQAEDINKLHDVIYVEETEGNTSETESYEIMSSYIPPPDDFNDIHSEHCSTAAGSEVPLLDSNNENHLTDTANKEELNVTPLLELKLKSLQNSTTSHIPVTQDIRLHELHSQHEDTHNVDQRPSGQNASGHVMVLLHRDEQLQPLESETSMDTCSYTQEDPQTSCENISQVFLHQSATDKATTHEYENVEEYFDELEEQLKQSFNLGQSSRKGSIDDSKSIPPDRKETVVTIIDTSIDTSVIPYIWSNEPPN